MRKITKSEMAILISTLAIANATSAEEPAVTTLPTVDVTARFHHVPRWGWTVNNTVWSPGVVPMNLGSFTSSQSSSNLHALNCAKAYAQTGPGARNGSPLGGTTYIVTNYMWLTTTAPYARTFTTGPTPPSDGRVWRALSGSTDITNDITLISLPHNPSHQFLINTIAHEWAHQWGANEADATSVGNAAELAYVKDNGDECGGITN